MVSQNAIIAALSSTALISLAPNVLLLLFPHYASGEGEHSSFLTLGQAMGAGGLLGDVFLHTIPHAHGGEDVGLWVLLGFTIFLVADMLLRWLGGGHSHNHSKDDKKHTEKDHHHEEMKTSVILLNLAADAMHNFTDGLAIGASFTALNDPDASVLSLLKSRGGIATLSILLHEVPHELSDFAILVKNGYSKRQAIMAQFGTALAAMAGTVVGIALEGFAGEALIYITAGGFVYLAACTILPEILEEKTTLKFRFLQLLFFGAGIAFLYGVSLLEGMDGGHHGHSHGHNHHANPLEHVHHIPPVEHIHDHRHHEHSAHFHSQHTHEDHHENHEHSANVHSQHSRDDHHEHHEHSAHAHSPHSHDDHHEHHEHSAHAHSPHSHDDHHEHHEHEL